MARTEPNKSNPGRTVVTESVGSVRRDKTIGSNAARGRNQVAVTIEAETRKTSPVQNF